MGDHASNRAVIKQIAVVFPPADEFALFFPNRQVHIKLGRDGIATQRGKRQTRQLQLFAGHILVNKHDLKNRRVGQIALRLQLFDQLLEGQILTRKGTQRSLANLRQQLDECRVLRHINMQCERVDKEANQPLNLLTVAIRYWRANHNVRLTTIPRQ